MNRSILEKYARLAIKTGINIQPGQIVVINAPLDCAEFARIAAETAYREGAGDVVINWYDELFQKIRYLNAPDQVFDSFPEWRRMLYVDHAREGAAFLSIYADDPELMREVSPERLARANKAKNTALKEYYERIMSNRNSWSIIALPTMSWASRVFPEDAPDKAIEKLWDAIIKAVRLDAADPVAVWKDHLKSLKQRLDFLNGHRFRFLKFHNSLGTDLTIELPKEHLWTGGADYTPEGVEFIANMPTEEVFTLPLRTGVNGTAVASMPLSYNGRLIKDFSLTFKEGRIVDFKAGEGYDSLKTLIETDEGSRYLGEVALVPADSPIAKSNILFLNTLFDENASCHLAIGRAYPTNLRNGIQMSQEELDEAGVNDSIVHEDFMIGTPDMDITGILPDGGEIPVFRNGRFAF
ncbi:MAG TPA: aminopeptidase [Thermoclostridium caenicola]|uniref:Aminopeptidase II. Metallo peptidase. MEROPS family M29 n=1 Tax=Thermoclostridium caenicola TaxID=659425 RepID=A0A1M6B837_9FIRM|nr:aminopeptidase [Thermoclostridium caenicola]SHI44909.1 aminopeptidase II. Metallo peptidase. MEROPS family M29 [Thermoclostridium caenicola]HOK42566.1 aminopeptidase [Thermoclostridium caenicola]HOL83926.1 aminopeptidase [Thermoclostridium caenicola]HOP71895.1 aminopeptidase [Thermoclostridium caenicola]HPO76318.1 aminopeptidase [Thermoclostridium caenicola]